MSEQATGASAVPRLSGEFFRQALLGEVSLPPDSPLRLDSRGARLEGAIVEGGLDLSAVNFDRPIVFERCTFEGAVSLRQADVGSLTLLGCRASTIDARGAEIRRDLVLDGTHLENFGEITFDGDGMSVGGTASFSSGFVSIGGVSLQEAAIGRSLLFAAATVRHKFSGTRATFPGRLEPGAAALDLTNVNVNGAIALARGFTVEGLVMCLNAEVGNNFVLFGVSLSSGGTWGGLVLDGVRIGGALVLAAMHAFEGSLLLSGCVARRFVDDSSLWRDPVTKRVRSGVEIELEGFRYEAFDVPSLVGTLAVGVDMSWQTRLDWLKAQPKAFLETDFRPQPFTQCAEVLRNMGDSHGAHMILFERERLRLKSKSVGFWGKLGGHVIGALAGYGYKNHYALYWALGVWLLGALVFGVADRLGEMRPADPHVLAEAHYEETGLPPRDYEPVNALLYSADIFLPIVELGQQQYWIPRNAGERRPDAQAAFPRLPAAVAGAMNWLFGGWLPKAYYYVEIAMGWLLVSIVIAGFSGLLGHAREE